MHTQHHRLHVSSCIFSCWYSWLQLSQTLLSNLRRETETRVLASTHRLDPFWTSLQTAAPERPLCLSSQRQRPFTTTESIHRRGSSENVKMYGCHDVKGTENSCNLLLGLGVGTNLGIYIEDHPSTPLFKSAHRPTSARNKPDYKGSRSPLAGALRAKPTLH